MAVTYYQIVNQTNFWVQFEETTLETCTDVAYTYDDLKNVYIDGNNFGDYWNPTETAVCFIDNHILFMAPIIKHIVEGVKDGKNVMWSDVFPTDGYITFKRNVLLLLKEKGISFSYAKNWFLTYKPSKRPKVQYDGRALNSIKGDVVNCVLRCINERFGSAIEQPGNRTKENKTGVVLLGKTLGITFDMAEQQNTRSFKEDIGSPYNPISDDKKEATYQELIKWFESIVPVDIIS